MKTRVAFAGRIRSGKDTAADYVASKYMDNGYAVQKMGFADAIGEVIGRYFPEAFENGKPREHYQVIGQVFRLLKASVWVDELIEHIESEVEFYNAYAEEELVVIVSDLRQQNELERLHEEGFVTVKVVAPEEVRLKRIEEKGDVYTPEALEHPTELSVDRLETHYTIVNDGTLEELQMKLDQLFESLKGDS